MKFSKTKLEGVWIIDPVRRGDSRGYFSETFRADLFERNIGHVDFVQENESMSRRGVLRGLHFQRGEASQAKLVRVTRGRIVDIAVDLRRSSPTFGKHLLIELDADSGRQVFIPRGFAHGFIVLSEQAQFQYKVDNAYCPEAECTLRYDDPVLAIPYPLPESDLILSDKDLQGVAFDDCPLFD